MPLDILSYQGLQFTILTPGITPLIWVGVCLCIFGKQHMSPDMRFPTMWYGRSAKAQTSLCIRSLIRAFASRLNILFYIIN